MKILGKDLVGGPGGFTITEDDKHWVEENFRWLRSVFGYPNKMEQQVMVTAKFFPATFASDRVTPENVITDLCTLCCINRDDVTFELIPDLANDPNFLLEREGHASCDTDLSKGSYHIYIAGSLVNQPHRLVSSLIYEFIRIRLTDSDLEFDVGGDDTGLFVYLAGIYYGFGIILAGNLTEAGQSQNGLSHIRWNYIAPMPLQVMAFSLATYADLVGDEDPAWKNELTGDFRKMFEAAMQFVKNNPNDLYDEKEVQANDLFNKADVHFERNEFEEAISTLQKILFITNDDHMKADVYNNMGYYYIRKQDYRLGISNFRKALALGPEYGFANDNLGYSLIMTGDLEEGLAYVRKAMDTGNNDVAYTYRNLALYHERRNEVDLAREYFEKALSLKTPVDLLEYHYAEFLLSQGESEEAKRYYQKSAEKMEKEGFDKLMELGVTKK